MSNDDLRETLEKRLELELGFPLTPQSGKQIDNEFNDSIILVDNRPIQSIHCLKIGGKVICENDYVIDDKVGIIYLDRNYSGLLYLEYIYGLDEDEFEPLLDLMMEYELDTGWDKNASSITEKSVSVSYDTSLGKGARIQSMIQDLRNRYSCVVEMI